MSERMIERLVTCHSPSQLNDLCGYLLKEDTLDAGLLKQHGYRVDSPDRLAEARQSSQHEIFPQTCSNKGSNKCRVRDVSALASVCVHLPEFTS